MRKALSTWLPRSQLSCIATHSGLVVAVVAECDQLRADEGSRSIAEPLPPGCWGEGWWVGEASTLCVVIEAA